MVKDINPRLVLIMTIIIGFFVGYDKNINDFLVLSRIIVFFPFYYLGILVRGNDSLKSLLYSYSVKKRVFSIFILGVLLILCLMFIDSLFVIKPYFSGRYPYSFIFEKNYLNIYSGLIRLISYCITLLMGYLLIILAPRCKLPVISLMGSKTLQIYFWHMIIINILRKLGIIKYVYRDNIVLIVLLGVALTIILGQSIFSFPTKWIRDGCLEYKEK